MYRGLFISSGIFVLIAFGFLLKSENSPNIPIQSNFVVDADNGETVFYASGCLSCHSSVASDNKFALGGGEAFDTAFGTFYAPNISMSSKYGIGNWSFDDFYTALKNGKSPSNENYFPVFPYSSYSNMRDQDIVDLWGYWQTLPTVDTPNKKHAIGFPFNIRKIISFWNFLYAESAKFSTIDDRSTYLVEALGHCTQCHTPRNFLGGLKTEHWFKGAVNPSGKGKIPSIHPSDLQWSKEEIAEYLSSGFTPEYDVAGGKMAVVIENTSKLSEADRTHIAEYLMRLNDD